MTTEDDFQAALDLHPEDWQTRLVFADWLEERGDVRAEGYRALGVLRRKPDSEGEFAYRWFTKDEWPKKGLGERALQFTLPVDWWELCETRFKGVRGKRRQAEDAAALAFSRLPASRRAELLTQPALC